VTPLGAHLTDAFAAVLRGETVGWGSVGATAADFAAACREQDLMGLVYRRLSGSGWRNWPRDVRTAVEREARAAAAAELLRKREVTVALNGLAAHGIRPILLKGTPLAYTVYESPSQRPRGDTDLLIPRDQVNRAREVMARLGYGATNYCDGELLFRQFELARADRFGVDHRFDVHWQISTQAAFADLLSYAELDAEAVPVPGLGPNARAAGPIHALLLACVHPAMHHRNVERLIWLYDIQLLAARLRPADLERFAELAIDRGVAAICASELARARARLGADIPPHIMARMSRTAGEPTTVYLEPGRRWHHELVANIRGLSRWSDRHDCCARSLSPIPRTCFGRTGSRAARPALRGYRSSTCTAACAGCSAC
jgi:hypothetical protein